MAWDYAYSPYIWSSIFSVLLLIALSIYSGRRRSVPGALPFTISCLFAAAWAVGSAMEIAAVDVQTKISWVKFQGACQIPIATAITCFTLEYAWPGRWLTRRNLALLSIAPLLFVGLLLTDDLHHLVWRGYSFDGTVVPQFGPVAWFFIVYALGLSIINIIVLTWLFLHSPQHRWPVVMMLIGLVGGRVIYVLEKAYILHADLPIDMFGMVFEFLMYATVLFGFHILDPIPLARQTAIEQLQAGMLVLDLRGRIVSLNPAAVAILGSPAKYLLGRPIQDLLPAGFDSAGDLRSAGAGQVEMSLGSGAGTRYYQLEASALNDWRGLAVGRLLLLHDVTEQKQAQAQLVEQQRALAMLHEREQLARELHDSLGQVFGYTSLRMEATRKLIADGKLAAADAQLVQLEHMVADAHADVREYILNLRTAPTNQLPFFSALQHYLDGFRKNYGIRIELSRGAGVDEEFFAPEAQMQLFRILQEAFSNARKHAQADCVYLSFELVDSLVRIQIQDNGTGFDPVRAAGEGHYGLRFMRERAELLGGTLRVDSAPGQGTCVVVEVPEDSVSSNQ
jgi:PAS domain S-box-containing protein